MKLSRLRYSWSMIALVMVAGCAQQTEVVKLYDSTGDGRQYERFLVIAIAGDPEMRRRLEDVVTGQLISADADAVPGYRETGPQTTLLQEEIDAAAERASADAVLVTHIVSVATTAELEDGRVDVLSECRGGDLADYFLYDYEELKEPDTVRIAHTVVVVTNLYDAASRERIWTIQSTCFEKATMDEVLLEEAEAITRQLQIDRLIG
jgi:hypothetical protein